LLLLLLLLTGKMPVRLMARMAMLL
jgi:hypothetical protein